MQELHNQVVVLQEFPHNVQERIFQIFMQELRNFLQNQTHPYRKFATKDAVNLLNHIAKHYNEAFNLDINFYMNKDGHIGVESDNMAYEIGVLPNMLKQFRKCYKCREKCYERETTGIIRDVG